jgi:hypothetical protein
MWIEKVIYMEDAEKVCKIAQEVIDGYSLIVINILDQPDILEKDKLNKSIQLILDETSRLKIPPKFQSILLSIIFISVIAPYILQQKCSKCQGNISKGDKSKQEDKGLEGMFA